MDCQVFNCVFGRAGQFGPYLQGKQLALVYCAAEQINELHRQVLKSAQRGCQRLCLPCLCLLDSLDLRGEPLILPPVDICSVLCTLFQSLSCLGAHRIAVTFGSLALKYKQTVGGRTRLQLSDRLFGDISLLLNQVTQQASHRGAVVKHACQRSNIKFSL